MCKEGIDVEVRTFVAARKRQEKERKRRSKRNKATMKRAVPTRNRCAVRKTVALMFDPVPTPGWGVVRGGVSARLRLELGGREGEILPDGSCS